MNICSRDFFNKTVYNSETLEQLWMSALNDTHEMICGCNHPFAHLFSILFPIGHSDRNKTIDQILNRDFKEKCRGGGLAGDAYGLVETAIDAAAGLKEEKEGPTEGKDDIDMLLAAAAAEENAR